MKILAFEFLTGGGVANQHPLNNDLSEFLHQGKMMLEAVCEDFVALGHTVATTIDRQVESKLRNYSEHLPIATEDELESALTRAASSVDGILLICPETNDCLARFAELLQPWKDRFLSPDHEFIKLTSNKWECQQWLCTRDVPCPPSAISTGNPTTATSMNLQYPLVAKPIDGAGSESVLLVQTPDELKVLGPGLLIQEYIDGTPVSVSAIRDRDGEVHFCEPGLQIFDGAPFGTQIGTQHSLTGGLRERALHLAQLATSALPPTRGYFGIDMVLGTVQTQDVIIEVNPRLTTSYCELRRFSSKNLASLFV